MLVGENISIAQSLTISLFGMIVSMFALILLMGFIILFRKIMSGRLPEDTSRKITTTEDFTAGGATEEETAAIIAAVSCKTGMALDSFVFKSINITADAAKQSKSADVK